MRHNTNILSIEAWWASLSGAEHIFWGVSIIFSVLFFFQFVLSLFGLELDVDTEQENFEANNSFLNNSDSKMNAEFTLLSIRSIIAFFTFFGWIGTIALSNGKSLLVALVSASLAGLIAMLIMSYLLYWFTKSEQTALSSADRILSKTGEVYSTIPGNREGQGKVHIQIGKSLREVDAITEHLTAIPTGSRIRITKVLDDELLIVEPLNN